MGMLGLVWRFSGDGVFCLSTFRRLFFLFFLFADDEASVRERRVVGCVDEYCGCGCECDAGAGAVCLLRSLVV